VTVLKRIASKQTASKQTASKQTASKQTASKQAASKQTASKQAASKQTVLRCPRTGIILDLADAPGDLHPGMDGALAAMARLEGGAIANADENRQVGHYWLRAPALAPAEAETAIAQSHRAVAALERGNHDRVLMIGIGGSALGPQFLRAALARPSDPASLHFIDNTDPEGIDRELRQTDPRRTLVIVCSKSGGTVETRNGMRAAQAWWRRHDEPFAPHAIAVTTPGSKLHEAARDWRARLPLWSWVGGRTSITGAVGLAPMALCGWDWQGFLAGARDMDAQTRGPAATNLAARLAATWFAAGNGRGARALVIEPYRDRLALLGRYLQQLVMESLGKSLDRAGRRVEQGLTVYGNKGSTDQHAFMQQIRDGRDDTLVHFVTTLDSSTLGWGTPDRGPPLDAGDDALVGDHLLGFQLGTRAALAQAGRPSVSLILPDVSAQSLGALIALWERAVGLYAELIDVNAYHQPGVEAGKEAAGQTLQKLAQLRAALESSPLDAATLGARCDCPPGIAWRLLSHLAETERATVERAETPDGDRFASADTSGT